MISRLCRAYLAPAAARSDQGEKEGGRPIERVVDDRLEGVPEPRIGDELGVGQEGDPLPEEIEIRERIGLSGRA